MGGVNEELAPQASAFTRSPDFICPLEFSLVIPRSRVDGEKNTKIPRRVSMGEVSRFFAPLPHFSVLVFNTETATPGAGSVLGGWLRDLQQISRPLSF